MHEAIAKTYDPRFHYPLLPDFLFPKNFMSEYDANRCVSIILQMANRIRAIDRSLNTQQLRAVAAIMSNTARPCPYVIFGPPGTDIER